MGKRKLPLTNQSTMKTVTKHFKQHKLHRIFKQHFTCFHRASFTWKSSVFTWVWKVSAFSILSEKLVQQRRMKKEDGSVLSQQSYNPNSKRSYNVLSQHYRRQVPHLGSAANRPKPSFTVFSSYERQQTLKTITMAIKVDPNWSYRYLTQMIW